MSETLQVLTYNIHKGFSAGKIKFMLPKMREAINAINADLVFLQEVQGEHKRKEKRIVEWPDSSQFEFLSAELWPHYAYGKNAIYQAGHHGNAILSKYEFTTWDNINLSNITRASRGLLHGIIDIANVRKRLHVICIHLGLFKEERKEQIDALCARIAEFVPANDALLIAGDFNDWRKETSDVLETGLGLREVFKEIEGDYAKSFPAWGPAFRNDRIYFRGLELENGVCLNKKPWRLLSDHLPLYAYFKIE